MKKINLSIFMTAALVAAFLCGIYFERSVKTETAKSEDPPRVFIEQLKTKMNISKNRNDVEIFLNGEKMTDDVKIDVKK